MSLSNRTAPCTSVSKDGLLVRLSSRRPSGLSNSTARQRAAVSIRRFQTLMQSVCTCRFANRLVNSRCLCYMCARY